jgi:hypothetical protein
MFSRLPGPPLTKDTAITTLLAHGVKVGIGILEQWSARNARFDAAWVCLQLSPLLTVYSLYPPVGCPGK